MSDTRQLLSAIESKNNEKVRRLVENMDIGEINKKVDGEIALGASCETFNDEALDLLLSKNGIDVNARGDYGSTPLHRASWNNNVYAVSKILTCPQADVNAKKNNGYTPLHYACIENNLQIVLELLMSPEIEVNVKTNRGCTPLHHACRYSSHEIVSALLTRPDIEVNVRDEAGMTPIMYSVKMSSKEVLKALLADSRVDLGVLDGQGRGLELLVGILTWEKAKTKEFLKMIKNERRERANMRVEQHQLSHGEHQQFSQGEQQQPSQAENQQSSQAEEQQPSQAEQQQPGHVEQQLPGQNEHVRQRIEKVEKLNNKIGIEEKKLRKNAEISKQKRSDLKKRQTMEKNDLNKKKKEEEASLKERHKEDEATLKKRHEEDEVKQKKRCIQDKATLDKKHAEEETALAETMKRENEQQQRHSVLKECRDELAQDLQIKIHPVQDTSQVRVKLEAAESSLECPVCLEFMKPPTRIWMCRLTHIICEQCKEDLEEKEQPEKGKCPTCVTERITQRAFVVENIARSIFD